ncbi:hypothetical protein FS837_003429 [Tulasnella sp. UAMH 9824]|nr:hypothetical protein FS837_003429 [Tulasnella sp. UAMH 9824]
MATAFDAKNPALFDGPVPPERFGQDGGKFYHYYDALADDIDDNMVTGLKEQLDGLLVFAGLFAGVNTAFLAFTLPLMSPDPADDTNALLRDILFNLASGRNDSLPSTNALPSETFSPTGKILTVNVLFSISLTFALVSSFLAVLGRQWLVYYRKRTGGGPESQRWEQLKRFLGAQRWRLEAVLDDVLPSLLQIGLIIFCISLTIYLNTLHPMLSNIVGAFMCVGLAILVATAIFAIWDKFCPFQSPLSHFILLFSRRVCSLLLPLLSILLRPLGWIAASLDRSAREEPVADWQELMILAKFWVENHVINPLRILICYAKRKEEEHGALQITAIRRAICTSDDARTQAHAVSNILCITDADLLARLAADEEFAARIEELCATSYDRTLQLCGRGQTDMAAAITWVYRAAITHILLSTRDLVENVMSTRIWLCFCSTHDGPSTLPSSDLMQNASPNMITACLGFATRYQNRDNIQTPACRLALRSNIDGLVNSSWNCISMIIEVMRVQWGIDYGHDDEVHAAWIGKPDTVHQNLKSLLERSNDPECPDRDILRQYLVDVFKLAGKAAADCGGDSSSRPAMAAGFLRFSEGLVRDRDSPSDLIDAGRNLRVELISAQHSECEKLSEKYHEYTSKDTFDELIQLFTELTPAPNPDSHEEQTVDVFRHQYAYEVMVGGRAMSTSSWDDEKLVHLFSPLLQQLNGIMIKNERHEWGDPNSDRDYLEFRRQVEELESTFAKFKAAVNTAAREIKVNSFLDLQY